MTPLTALALAELPSLPLEGRRELPDTAAIYFVLAGDTVLYIGQSASLCHRWAAHHRLAQLGEYGTCRIAWMDVSDVGLLDELERACIAHFRPILNNSTVLWEDWTLTIRLPRELETAVRRLARERLVQPSVVVRQLVKERLDELEPGQAKS